MTQKQEYPGALPASAAAAEGRAVGEQIRRGTRWTLLARGNSYLLHFAFGVVLARLLTPADFGLVATIQVFTGFAGLFAGGGMGQALVQAKEVEDRDYRVVFTAQLAVGVLIYLLFFSIAPWFAWWFDNDLYKGLLRVSAVTFLIRPLQSVSVAMLSRAMRFKPISLTGITGLFATGVVSVALAFSGAGVWSIVLGGLVGGSANALGVLYASGFRPGLAFSRDSLARLGSYGTKIAILEVVSYAKSQTSTLFVSHFLGPSPTGIYNKASSLRSMPTDIVGASVYQPVFRALSGVQDNLDKTRYMYLRTLLLVTVYTYPLYVGLLWLAEPFIRVVYGEQWVSAAEPLQILAATGFLLCLGTPAGAVVAAQNRLGRELRVQLESWALLMVGLLMGVRWGIHGVAVAVTVVTVYTGVRMTVVAASLIKLRLGQVLRALQPALALSGIVLAVFVGAAALDLRGLLGGHEALYLAAMTVAGAGAYAAAFLLVPFPELATEAGRWRRLLWART